MIIKYTNYADGIHFIDLSKSAGKLGLDEPFCGTVLLNCKLDKSHSQIVIDCDLILDTQSMCDRCAIDIKNELLEATKVRDDNKKADKNKNQIDDKKSKGIYANFKNYNVKGVNAKNTSTRSIICDNSNRYSYKGKVNEYSILKTDDYKCKKETPMSYEKFKEMMNKKK